MKKCVKCAIEKPFSEFFKKTASKDGYQPWCKACKNKTNAEECVVRRKRNKLKLFEKMGNSCQRCGIVPECQDVFDLHHIDPTQKERNITDLMMGSWKALEKELDKCVLLCSNCHRVVHHELRNSLIR